MACHFVPVASSSLEAANQSLFHSPKLGHGRRLIDAMPNPVGVFLASRLPNFRPAMIHSPPTKRGKELPLPLPYRLDRSLASSNDICFLSRVHRVLARKSARLQSGPPPSLHLTPAPLQGPNPEAQNSDYPRRRGPAATGEKV